MFHCIHLCMRHSAGAIISITSVSKCTSRAIVWASNVVAQSYQPHLIILKIMSVVLAVIKPRHKIGPRSSTGRQLEPF